MLDALPVAVAVFDGDLKLTAFNEAYAALWHLDDAWLKTGPEYAAILDKLRADRRLPEQVDFQSYKKAQLAAINPPARPARDTLHLPDGASIMVTIAPTGGGHTLCCYRDATQTLSAERAFNELQSIQHATLEHLREGLAVFGPDGRLKYANPAFLTIWSLDTEAASARLHLTDFLDATRTVLPVEADWPGVKAKLAGRLMGRRPGQSQLTLNTGVTLEASHLPLPDGGALLRYADISDSVTLQHSLQEEARTAQTENRLKTEFLATLSHELRTPLTTISGFAELLAGDYFGELNQRQRDYADGIEATTSHILSLVEDTLELATIESGRAELARNSFDLHALLVSLLALVRQRARDKGITLKFDCPPDIGWIGADEPRLKKAFLHLLNNALRFTGSGGTITLGAARDEDGVTIQLTDNGAGMPKDDLDTLLQGFATDREPASTGLGLVVVKNIIELHGGTLEINSKVNRGTVVTCRLPLTDNGSHENRV